MKNRIAFRSLILNSYHLLSLGILVGLFYGMASIDMIKRDRKFSRSESSSESMPLGESLLDIPSNITVHIKGEDYSLKGKAIWNGNLQCPFLGKENGDASYLRLKNIFNEEILWKKDSFNIFLTETSCDPNPAYRVWCSVESMAQQNPDAVVWYVMTSQEVDVRNGLVKRILQQYPNLRIVTVNLAQVFDGTPLKELYYSEAWNKNTKWPAANLSNMIRMAIVWQVGGFYSDTDAICIAPITALRNVIGLATFNLVNGAAFHFNQHHPILQHFMAYLNKNFDPYTWGKNGPQTVSAVLRSVCGEDILFQGLECQGAKILPATAFNPIPPHAKRFLFHKSSERDMNKRFPNSYTIHFWNRVTHDDPVVRDSGSIYDLASAAFCPNSREAATKNSILY